MDRLRILGPSRLEGTVQPAGAKNAALPEMAACLLTDQAVTLEHLPAVRDIRTMERLLEHLGVECEEADGALRLEASGTPSPDDAPYDLVKQMRASVLVLGPLLARRGHASVSLPGGCAIGVRPIDQHLAGLEALGAEVTLEHGYITARARRLVGARYRFTVPTVGGTENLLMAASLARGTTVLDNCAREPEIVDLARLLTAMGARIEGAGEETVEIEGVDSLHSAHHRVIPDRIEGGTYLIAAALTGGSIQLEACRPDDLTPLLEKLSEAGCRIDIEGDRIGIRRDGDLRPRSVITAPHPGFPTDFQAQYMVLMTQAHGTTTICERVFENRFQHVPELARMGADIQVDGSDAVVRGPSPLSGAALMATDLRASACLVLAGLLASGETIVDRIYHLDRGYSRMEEKLRSLGARVERLSSTPGRSR